MVGETEYGFSHLLVRDVCYAQIPRAARAARHQAAAAWIERKAGERAEDLADVLAHHYLTALELARAAGQQAEAKELATNAIRYLALAGERALALDVDRAEQNLARALQLAPERHPERASLLERWAKAAQQRGRLKEAREALEEALAIHRQQAETVAAGRVLAALSNVLGRLGDPRSEEAIAEALRLLEAQRPGPELLAAYAQFATVRHLRSAYPEAIKAAERALALAAELGLPEPPRAFAARGAARCYIGERAGVEDIHRALALAVEQGESRTAALVYHYLAIVAWHYEGYQAGLAALRDGVDFCERRGIVELALAIASERLHHLAALGHTDEALAEARPLAERMQAVGEVGFIEARSLELRLLVDRGAHEQAPAADDVLARARGSGEPQFVALAFGAAARQLLAQGRPQQSKALLVELEQVANIRADPYYASLLPDLVRTALALDEPELASGLVHGAEPRTPLDEHAITACRAQLAEAAGEQAEAATLHAEAADRWRGFGNMPERAYALLGQGRCLTALGKPEAAAPLRKARELFASMGYKPALAETEALLGEGEAAAV
jgi:tetratricopeptide (TPR) repeat protein